MPPPRHVAVAEAEMEVGHLVRDQLPTHVARLGGAGRAAHLVAPRVFIKARRAARAVADHRVRQRVRLRGLGAGVGLVREDLPFTLCTRPLAARGVLALEDLGRVREERRLDAAVGAEGAALQTFDVRSHQLGARDDGVALAPHRRRERLRDGLVRERRLAAGAAREAGQRLRRALADPRLDQVAHAALADRVRGPRGARHGLRHGHSIITALAFHVGRRRRRERRPRREPRRLVRRARQRRLRCGARFRRRRGEGVVARRQRRPGCSPRGALRRRGQHFGRRSDGHFLRRLAKPNFGQSQRRLVPSLAVPKDTSVDSTPSTRRRAVVTVADAKYRAAVDGRGSTNEALY